MQEDNFRVVRIIRNVNIYKILWKEKCHEHLEMVLGSPKG